MRSALCCLKSSNWMRQPGQTSSTPRHERLDQLVVRRAAQPRRPIAEVQRIGEQRRVVGADVERDRQGQRRMDAAGGRVQRELADRDGHPARALVAEAEDPLVVGHDDEPDVLERALAQDLGDAVDVGRRDPRPARAPDDVAELLARPPDGRRVDDRQELLEVLAEESIEQGRVAVLERGQADVLLERVVLDPQVLELELDLLVDGQDAVGEQAAQPERVALVDREGELLGQQPRARAGPVRRGAMRAGRPAAMSSNGAGSGRTASVSWPDEHVVAQAAAHQAADPPRRTAPARLPLARRRPRRRDVHVRRRCRGGHADRPSRDGRLPRRHGPPALRAEGRRAAAAADARPASSCGRRSSSRAGSPRRGPTSPAPSATPATRSATTGTSTRASAARTRRPRRATCCAGSRRSTRCWASDRSAIDRRRAT